MFKTLDEAIAAIPQGWLLTEMGEHYDAPLRAEGPWFAILCEPQRPMNDGGSGGGGDPYVRCTHAKTPLAALSYVVDAAREMAAA